MLIPTLHRIWRLRRCARMIRVSAREMRLMLMRSPAATGNRRRGDLIGPDPDFCMLTCFVLHVVYVSL
jgi:hypothetical protein